MSRPVRIVARDLMAAHRANMAATVSDAALPHAQPERRQQARTAFRDAWRDYIARTMVAAEYAIAEEEARKQLAEQEARNGSPQA